MKRGKFVVVEGGEGSGKTTALDRLKAKARDRNLIITREPGGSEFGEEIRRTLFSERGKTFNPHTQFHLFFAARTDHVKNVIVPALEDGINVVSDRFSGSTFAHQIFGEGNSDLRLLFQVANDSLRKWIVPPAYIYLDVDPVVGLARKTQASDGNFFDLKGIDYHHRVRQGYREFAKYARVDEIDANRSKEEVWQDFSREVEKALA